MKDFTFYNPTRMEFGKDKEKNIGQFVSEFGYQKVLIIYGSERVKKNGLFEKVITSLDSKNIEFIDIGGVVSNPLLSKVNEAIKLAREKSVDAILAVGGGSVLDTAKAVAAGVKYDGDVWDFFCGKATVQEALPMFSILTLAATGSEMDPYGVVMNDETKEKYTIISPYLYPKVSVINPELMSTVTKDYLAYSAVDIISHCLDSYFTAKYMPELNRTIIENLIKTVMRTTEILLENPNNYDARAEFAWSSSMALNGITFVGGEGYAYDSHMLEHSVSALYDVPHGAGLAVTLPACMKWDSKQNSAPYKRFAKEVFGLIEVDEGIEALESWFKKIGAPTTLEELNIPREAINDIAENALGLVSVFGFTDRLPKKTMIEILELA